ncbi:MAG: hypothetical protein M1835_003024 [Candelina submexicana]|nr:MAG: hypothetical protein M1835_003024 [Candelina submexicana]
MLSYLYTFDYVPASEVKIHPVLLHARVYIIADEFDIPALKMLAKEKFKRIVETDWNNESFSLAVKEIYELLPKDRGLRDVVVQVAREHVKALRDRGDFNAMLKEKPEFTVDLLDKVLNVEATREDEVEKSDADAWDQKWMKGKKPQVRSYCIDCSSMEAAICEDCANVRYHVTSALD